MITSLVILAGGLILLAAGAEALVRGASGLARLAGLSPLAVGLTVVAYGTSAPELAVNVGAAVAGQSDIAVGNVVGSNLFNILVILGLSALAAPLIAERRLLRRDVPIMLGTALVMVLFCLDRQVSRWEGLFLALGLAIYTVTTLRRSADEPAPASPPDASSEPIPPRRRPGAIVVQVSLVAIGLAALVLGARWMVSSSVDLARLLGVSELVIGLTVVAAGTSLPELATSVLATLRGHRQIAVGNVVGSNIYNVLAVLGISSMIHPIEVSTTAIGFDVPFMLVASVAAALLFHTDKTLKRREGVLLLLSYAAYIAVLVTVATGSADSTGTSRPWLLPLVGALVGLCAVGWLSLSRTAPCRANGLQA